jgi:hypothetical protein
MQREAQLRKIKAGDPVAARSGRGRRAAELALEHDPEKWVPVFGKDHAD